MEATAYHEAGHAVVAIDLGGDVRRLTLEPEWDDAPRRLGDTQVAWLVSRFTERQRRLHSATVALAGPVAEMIYTGEPPTLDLQQAWSDDWRQARLETAAVFQGERRQIDFLHRQIRALRRFLNTPEAWAAVAALADELLAHETLDQEQIATVARQWLGF